MRKEDTSAQGKIVTEILQHLHACNNSVKVFYGRIDELVRLKNYICGESKQPFVLYGAGGSGKTSMLSMMAAKSLQEWLKPAKPLLIVRLVFFCIFSCFSQISVIVRKVNLRATSYRK